MRKIEPNEVVFFEQRYLLSSLEYINDTFLSVNTIQLEKDNESKEKFDALLKYIDNTIESKSSLLDDIDQISQQTQNLNSDNSFLRNKTIKLFVIAFEEYIAALVRLYFKQSSALLDEKIDDLLKNSLIKQIQYLDNKLDLKIEENFKEWKLLIDILENNNIDLDKSILNITDNYISNAFSCFYELGYQMCQGVSRHLFKDDLDLADNNILDVAYKFLLKEQWLRAAKCYAFIKSIPDELIEIEDFRLLCHINYCIALKFSDQPYKKELHSMQWTQHHPIYYFAVKVLDDEFDEAEELLYTDTIQALLPEKSLKKFPLLYKFRESAQFKRAYKKLYNKDYEEGHVHDEDCGCGQDHEHEHEHEHDEDCDCGHDHDHEHEHDDNCDCGHDHEHEHTHDDDCDCGHDH